MTKTRHELIDELRSWGANLIRTNNKLSKREIEAFHRIQKDAIGNGMKDSDIDLALKESRYSATPKPRYEEVPSWIS